MKDPKEIFKAEVKTLEESVEKLSSSFPVLENSKPKKGWEINLADKPATKFLTAMGAKPEENPLTAWDTPSKASKDGEQDAEIEFLGSGCKLIITKGRQKELYESAKIYLNTGIITEEEYLSIRDTKSQDIKTDEMGNSWEKLSIGVVHAQKIDLLLEQFKSETSQGPLDTYGPKNATIKPGETSITLLSSPVLKNTDSFYIDGMYRNLFSAALQEGCDYITMSMEQCDIQRDDEKEYFYSLLKIAKEFPELNIIFCPKNLKKIEHLLILLEPVKNLAITCSNVVFIADQLRKQKKKCALHNPSHINEVYGKCDVGNNWKSAVSYKQYMLGEHIASISTASLNSYGLNPEAFSKVTCKNLQREAELKVFLQEEAKREPVFGGRMILNQLEKLELRLRDENKDQFEIVQKQLDNINRLFTTLFELLGVMNYELDQRLIKSRITWSEDKQSALQIQIELQSHETELIDFIKCANKIKNLKGVSGEIFKTYIEQFFGEISNSKFDAQWRLIIPQNPKTIGDALTEVKQQLKTIEEQLSKLDALKINNNDTEVEKYREHCRSMFFRSTNEAGRQSVLEQVKNDINLLQNPNSHYQQVRDHINRFNEGKKSFFSMNMGTKQNKIESALLSMTLEERIKLNNLSNEQDVPWEPEKQATFDQKLEVLKGALAWHRFPLFRLFNFFNPGSVINFLLNKEKSPSNVEQSDNLFRKK